MNTPLAISRLLIIEDFPDDVFLIRHCLDKANVKCDEVIVADNGETALKLIKENEFDLILMDFNLPDMTAIEIIQCLKDQNLDLLLPILSITAAGSEKVAVELMKLGVIDYLPKDELKPESLRSAIDYSLEQITKQRHRKKQLTNLKKLGLYDRLTTLPNRNLFYDRLQQAIISAKRNDLAFALLFMDMNGFKQINDNHGHSAGDEIISVIGKRLANSAREADTIARYGGDEFVVILPNTKTTDDAKQVAEKIGNTIKEPVTVKGKLFEISVAIGISIYPHHGNDMHELIHFADIAMYEAKKKGVLYFSF